LLQLLLTVRARNQLQALHAQKKLDYHNEGADLLDGPILSRIDMSSQGCTDG